MKATKQITHFDGSISTSVIDNNTNPIGACCEHSFGMNSAVGYVELHPHSNSTIQVTVDQGKRTININGFWKSLSQDAINSITLQF
jgi:hypothetical protein